MWGASKVTAEGVASASLIFGLFLRGMEKKIPFLEGLKKKGGVSKGVEDCFAIFDLFFLGGKSRVTSFIARSGGVEMKWNDHEYVCLFFALFKLPKERSRTVNLLASFRSTP